MCCVFFGNNPKLSYLLVVLFLIFFSYHSSQCGLLVEVSTDFALTVLLLLLQGASVSMKEKANKKEDWYLPWVIRPELIRAHQEWQRSSMILPSVGGGSGSSTGANTPSTSSTTSPTPSPQNPPSARPLTIASSPLLLHQPPGSPRKRPIGPSVSCKYMVCDKLVLVKENYLCARFGL